MGPQPGYACKVCLHPERPAIDVGLAEHRSIQAMKARFGVSLDSLYRHRRKHMTKEMLAKLASGSAYVVENLTELKTKESERLLANAVEVRRRLYANAEGAEKTGDYKAATASYAVIIRSLELIGKLLDQFKGRERTTVNQLLIAPDYIRLRGALLHALLPFPEARMAVAKVLRDLESVEVEATKELTNGTGG